MISHTARILRRLRRTPAASELTASLGRLEEYDARRQQLMSLYGDLHGASDRSENELRGAIDYGLRIMDMDIRRHQTTLVEAERLCKIGRGDSAARLLGAL